MKPVIKTFKILVLIFLASVFVFACKPDSYNKTIVMLNLTGWNLPDTIKVATNFDMYLSTQTTSSCEKKAKFVISQIADDAYKVYGSATYESYNDECHEKVVEIDTTFSGSISKVGRYYFLFLKENKWNVDSIQVVP